MCPKDLSEEDKALFRNAVGKVRQLADDRVSPARVRRNHDRAHRHAAHQPAPSVSGDMLSDLDYPQDAIAPGDEIGFCRAGVGRRVLKRLKRGAFPIDAELDLHGLTVAQASAALSRFLDESSELNIRCVRIVHGKGFGSRDGVPVIKSRLYRWLRMRTEVLAFTSVRPRHGGTGAVHVLLKS